jgi:hypothetical protein
MHEFTTNIIKHHYIDVCNMSYTHVQTELNPCSHRVLDCAKGTRQAIPLEENYIAGKYSEIQGHKQIFVGDQWFLRRVFFTNSFRLPKHSSDVLLSEVFICRLEGAGIQQMGGSMRRTYVCYAWTGEGHCRIIWARGIRSLVHHARIQSSGCSRLLQDLQPSPILNELSPPRWNTACVPVQPLTNWSAAAQLPPARTVWNLNRAKRRVGNDDRHGDRLRRWC